MENSTVPKDPAHFELVIRPTIRNFKWVPEVPIGPDGDALFDFEIVNENALFNVYVSMMRIELNSKSDGPAGPFFPGTITTIGNYDPPDPPVRMAFTVNGSFHAGNTYLLIPKDSSRKLYGNLKTFSRGSITYPLPFSMTITFDWKVSIGCKDHGTAVIEKTIEPPAEKKPAEKAADQPHLEED